MTSVSNENVPALAHVRNSPAFLSFLFLYTEKITSRFPKISTTIVNMRKHPRVVVTQGGRWNACSLGSSAELFRELPFINIVYLHETFLSQQNKPCSSGGARLSGRISSLLEVWLSCAPRTTFLCSLVGLSCVGVCTFMAMCAPITMLVHDIHRQLQSSCEHVINCRVVCVATQWSSSVMLLYSPVSSSAVWTLFHPLSFIIIYPH